MEQPSVHLVEIAAKVCDSKPVDWTKEVESVEDRAERRAVEKLRQLQRLLVSSPTLVHAPDAAPEPTRGLPFARWGELELVEKLGEGTSGEVFLARDTLRRDVALKLFKVPASELNDYQKERLKSEGRRHARVKHENVSVIYDSAEHEGRLGIWMEYVPGSTPDALLKLDEHGPFSAAEATAIGVELCRALAAVHGKDLTHGDVKAQNVMREQGGRIVLMDFSAAEPLGEAPASGEGIVGTPLYTAPERLLERAAPTPQSDIYSLGVLLFYLVTGTFPVVAGTLDELHDAHRRGDRRSLDDVRPGLPRSFVDAVDAALEPDPRARVDSAAALESRLGSALPRSDLFQKLEKMAAALTVAAKVGMFVVLGGIAFAATLAIVGFVARTNFNLAVRLPEGFFAPSLLGYMSYGFRAMILSYYILLQDLPKIVPLLGLGAVVVGLYRARGHTAVARLKHHTAWASSVVLAALFTCLSVGLFVGVTWFFRELWVVGMTMEEITEPTANLALLSPTCELLHQAYSISYARLGFFLLALWLPILVVILRRKENLAAALSLHGVSGVVIVTTWVMFGLMWPLLWFSEFEPVRVDGQKGYVVAEEAGRLFVYSPASAERRHAVVEEGEPSVERYARGTAEILFGELQPESCLTYPMLELTNATPEGP